MCIKNNCVSNFRSKVGLSNVKALVNSTTQQCYQLPSIGNRYLEIQYYGDLMATTFSANLAHSACGLLI